MSCPDCAAAFDQGWSAVEERYADLLAAAEAVLNDAYMPDLISGGHVCLNCNFNLNSGEHHAECPIPALAAAIKKAKGQQQDDTDGCPICDGTGWRPCNSHFGV